MLVVVSPAKRLDWSERGFSMSEPEFQGEASRLAGHARQLSLGDLKSLMSLSDDLARLNRDRFRAFAKEPQEETTRPALYAFAGDTYQGIDAATLSDDARICAQSNLRILSGLYGLLRPMDAIQPYRLEMGSRLKTRRGNSLYDFWGPTISKALNREAEEAGTDVLLNCASQEYFRAVDLKALKLRVLTPVFLEEKDGAAKIISFFAKKARGSLARYVVENRISDPEALKGFSTDGYRFQGQDGDTLTFLRSHDALAV